MPGLFRSLQGTTERYVGRMSDRNVERLMDITDERTVTELITSSGGGEAGGGRRMGEWVYDRRMEVVVEGICI